MTYISKLELPTHEPFGPPTSPSLLVRNINKFILFYKLQLWNITVKHQSHKNLALIWNGIKWCYIVVFFFIMETIKSIDNEHKKRENPSTIGTIFLIKPIGTVGHAVTQHVFLYAITISACLFLQSAF